ncbi:MAG TPA: hypothetical protein VL068_00255 [Microthrixaceae bacterium]|nr:hypothetical protein [Microthrixaceae bacterium]
MNQSFRENESSDAVAGEGEVAHGSPRPNRRIVAVATLVVAIIGSLFGLVVPAGASTSPSPEALAAAASGRDWLAGRLKAEMPLEVFGSPSWGTTLDAAFALAAVDVADPLLETIWDSAVTDRDAIVNDGSDDIPGRLAQMILLANTLDKDPRNVGSSPGNDLVARLVATMTPTGGPDAGLFGVQSPTYDGVYRQGQSLAALASAGESVNPLAVAWLLDQQCQGAFDGAWLSYRSDTSVPCVSDPIAWVGPDSNASAYAVTGLVEAVSGDSVVDGAVDAGLTWFDLDQKADGGWGGYPWADTDPNSTAVVIQALIATGTDGEARFADQTGTAVSALLSFQLGASAPLADRGAFTYPGTANSPSEMATVQAVVAAAGYPVIFRPAPKPPTTTTTVMDPPNTTTTVPDAGPGPINGPADGPVDRPVERVRAISLAG